ncbi:MAG: outer membrane protein assembly factor BamB family protein [Planctomycetota bacterium]|jgi:outer membrane protein assembly factor BamB
MALVFLTTVNAHAENLTTAWPQAAGPRFNYHAKATAPPVSWSVARGENILWQTDLPEGGQSTPVVWGDRLFITTMEPWPGDDENPAQGAGARGYCLNADTGEVLWSVKLPGTKVMKYAGIFSDTSSPSPVTDGRHVWFFNAGGSMGCWDFDGQEVWRRRFEPRTRHHSRQHEPILFGDTIFYLEVKTKEGANVGMHKDYPAGTDTTKYWTHLHAIDKHTGKVKWIVQDGTAVHNTATLGFMRDGSPALMHGRGGGHAPLEKPYGLSLSSIAPGREGETIWRHDIAKGSSHYTAQWNAEYAVWFDGPTHLVFDTQTGEPLRRQDLQQGVTDYAFDEAKGRYVKTKNATVATAKRGNGAPITHMTNLLVGDYHYFMSHDQHRLGRVNVETGRVEYVQAPLQVVREKGAPDRMIWDPKEVTNDTRNSRGIDVGAVDKRSKGSGWGHVSAATPIAINDKVYLSSMTGLTYVIQADAEDLTPDAIVAINDLGPAGHTWSISQLAPAGNRIYARTLKGVVCIGKE